jgi:hypothetical protein
MIRLAIYAILIYGCYRLLKSFAGGLSKPPSQPERGGVVGEAELIKDPQCGAYFLKQTGVQAKVNGKPVFFCSESCRDAYLREKPSH